MTEADANPSSPSPYRVDRRSIVTALTLARLPFVALGYWGALAGDALATVTFGLTAVATDIADGRLARRWGVTSEWGSNLDSLADVTFYSSLILWVYLFVPEPVERHAGLIGFFFAAYMVMLVAGYFFNRSIAVHNRISRAAGTAGGMAALYFIVWGWEEWIFFAITLFGMADLGQRLHSVVHGIAVWRGEQRAGE